MGFFNKSQKNQKRAARNTARELMRGIGQAQNIWDPAYQAAIGRLDPTTAEMRNWLTQGKNAQLGAYENAYNTATGAINTGLGQATGSVGTARGDINTALNAMQANYGQALGALNTGYNTSRGDVSTSLSAQLAAINQAKQEGQGFYQPYLTAGQGGLDRSVALTTPGTQVSAMQMDPGYQFRMNQGLQGVTNSAAGGVFGGNTLRALNDYAQGQASNEFGNVYNRNMGLAGLGLQASSGAAGLSQWAGGAGAAANQWAGGLNANLASQLAGRQADVYGAQAGANQWAGNQNANLQQYLAGLQSGAGNNLANLATGYGQQQAGTLGNYYGANYGLTGEAANQLNQLAFGQAGMQADYAMQRANAQAARETTQGNVGGNSWLGPLTGLAGTLGGAALGNPYLMSSIGSWLGGGGGGGGGGISGGIAGIGGGGTWGGPSSLGYGWGSSSNRYGSPRTY